MFILGFFWKKPSNAALFATIGGFLFRSSLSLCLLL
jgi:SSS family solute:Na+ symporter